MSYFVTVFDRQKYLKDGAQSEYIIDWGEYRNTQQAVNLAVELLSRWPWDTPVQIEHRTERGGGSAGCIWHIASGAAVEGSIKWKNTNTKQPELNFDEIRWRKTPTWKPEAKGLIFLGGFQVSPYLKHSPEEFKEWTGYSKDSPDGQLLLKPIPIQIGMRFFGCRRNRQTKEHVKELMIREYGPGQTWDLNEAKMRMFGRVDDDPYSTSRESSIGAEPRPYWTIHTYEMDLEGNLKHESIDFLEACIKLYGTDDLEKMKSLNSWDDHKIAAARKSWKLS